MTVASVSTTREYMKINSYYSLVLAASSAFPLPEVTACGGGCESGSTDAKFRVLCFSLFVGGGGMSASLSVSENVAI